MPTAKSVESFVKGPITFMDLSGKTIAIVNAAQAVSTSNLGSLLSRNGIYIGNKVFLIKARETNGSIITKRISTVR